MYPLVQYEFEEIKAALAFDRDVAANFGLLVTAAVCVSYLLLRPSLSDLEMVLWKIFCP
jgi:hypothetical protein